MISPKRKARRRRESGLLPPPHPSQIARQADLTNDYGEIQIQEHEEASRRPSAGDLEMPAGLDAEPSPLATVLEAEPPISAADTDSRLGESTSTGASEVDSALTASSSITSAMEEGARGRRSRSSVNYKEPSLTK